MGDLASKALAERQGLISQQLGNLAYNRLDLTRQIEQMDTDIAKLEAQYRANDQARKDLETEAAVEAAKAEGPEKATETERP